MDRLKLQEPAQRQRRRHPRRPQLRVDGQRSRSKTIVRKADPEGAASGNLTGLGSRPAMRGVVAARDVIRRQLVTQSAACIPPTPSWCSWRTSCGSAWGSRSSRSGRAGQLGSSFLARPRARCRPRPSPRASRFWAASTWPAPRSPRRTSSLCLVVTRPRRSGTCTWPRRSRTPRSGHTTFPTRSGAGGAAAPRGTCCAVRCSPSSSSMALARC